MKQTKHNGHERRNKKAKTTALNRTAGDKNVDSYTNTAPNGTLLLAAKRDYAITSSKQRQILSEKLHLLDQSIREIEAKQIDSTNLLAAAREKEIEWSRQVEMEQSQCKRYAAQRANQEGFLRRLEQSMAQTQSVFEKLHPPSQDELAEERNESTDDNSRTNNEFVAVGMTEASPESTINMNQSDEMEEIERGAQHPTNHGGIELSWPDVDGFWNVMRPEQCVALSNYLCSITSEATLKATMDLTTREILYMDLLDPSGQHRSEAMRYTCLDFGLVASLSNVAAGDAAAVVVTGTSTFTPCSPYHQDAFKTTIDPNVALCPYDLAGNCEDLDCPYQHVRVPSLRASILPRELLPLPKLLFGMDEKHRPSAPATKVSQGRPIDDLEDSKPHQDCPKNNSTGGTMDDPSDFIALPEADEHFTNDDNDTRLANIQFAFWWKKNPDATSLDAMSSQVPFSAVLRMLGATISSIGNGTKILQLSDISTSSSTSTRPEWCRHAGMLLDCTRLALHSGRFDVSSALHKLGVQMYSNLASFDKAFAPIFAGCCLHVLELSGNEAFSLTAKTRGNVFRQAFESQVRISLASFFFQQLCNVFESANGNDNLTEDDLNDWAKCLEEVTIDTSPINTLSPEEIVSAFASVFSNLDTADTPSQLIATVFSSVQTVIAMRASLLLVKAHRVLIDNVLHPMFKTIRKTLLNQSNGESSVIGGLLFLNVVIDVLQNFANHQQSTGAASDLLEANDVVDRLLLEVRSLCAESPTMDCMLTPVFAANVALAVYLKRYHTANTRLANMLGARTVNTHGFAPYSELLWSQLVQLRMSLPLRSIDSVTDPDTTRVMSLLEQEPDSSHSALANSVFKMEVFPHHVFLSNDWNIVRILHSSGLFDAKRNTQKNKRGVGCPWAFRSSCRSLHQSLICNEMNSAVTFDFRKEHLTNPDGCNQLQAVSSTIPYSLLLGGSSIIKLNLSGTGMKRLPLHFGMYFPRLQILDLSCNALQEFPLTMDKMSALEELHFGENKISILPESFFFPNLTLLFAQNNRLTGLPESLAECSKLRRLNLFGNPVGPSFWRVAARLHLLELQPQMQKT